MGRWMLAILAGCVMAGLAHAELVSFAFTGTSQMPFGEASVQLGSPLGSPTVGVITYDPAVVGVGNAGLMVLSSPGSLQLRFGNYTFTSLPGAQFTIFIRHMSVKMSGTVEYLNFGIPAADPGIFGQPASGWLSLNFSSVQPSLNEMIPTDLSQYNFSFAGADAFFTPLSGPQQIGLGAASASVNEVHPVASAPEPAPLFLAGIGIGLAVLRSAFRGRMPRTAGISGDQ